MLWWGGGDGDDVEELPSTLVVVAVAAAIIGILICNACQFVLRIYNLVRFDDLTLAETGF